MTPGIVLAALLLCLGVSSAHAQNIPSLSWTARLNGQALGESLGTAYSPFARGPWPIYFYHTVDSVYSLNGKSSLGLELSATQDLVHGVRDSSHYPIEPTFTIYDPQIWYHQGGLLDNEVFRLDGQVSLFPPLTSYSRNYQEMLMSAAFDTTWNMKLKDHRWTAYLTTRVRPTFYSQNQPPLEYPHFGEQRERLFVSAGHFLSYHFSDRIELAHSSLFDCNYYADASGLFVRGDANDDRTQLMLNYYIPSGFARLGAYVQGLVMDPRLGTTVVGVDLTFNLLTAR